MSVDATNRPLLIPPEFATYAENHGIFELYQRLMKELIIHKPDDPLTFLVDQLQKRDDDVPQIIVMGPPASGKRSIARMVCNKLRTAHVTPDGLINEADAKLKDEAMSYVAAGKEIPNELWMRLVDQRLQLFDCVKKGWVMDGFPKTREQALAMQAKGITAKHVVLLQAPDTVLIERAAGKRIDPTTGDIYHTTFDWPNDPEVESRLQTASAYSEEELVDRLVLHHRHLDGVLKCFEKAHKVVNADQPKADVFAQVMTFLATSPRSAAPHTPRIVLLGPTGSGKAVQAALLANKYNIVNVSCGQLIKQAIADESKFGSAAKPYVDDGLLVPDSIVLSILKERLTQLDCVSRGWVLRGYPQTREQAEQLAFQGLVPNRAFFLDVPNDSVMERLTMRATDPITGNRYHALFNPPQTHDVKDRLKIHPKDDEEDVRKRLSSYNAYQEELQDYYLDAQRVNADQDPHTVFECIESMMVNPLPKQLEL